IPTEELNTVVMITLSCLRKVKYRSVTQTGSPYDNAIAERVNGILKMEFDLEKTFKNVAQARAFVELGIHKYNNIRMHASCYYQTPQNTHVFQNIITKQQ